MRVCPFLSLLAIRVLWFWWKHKFGIFSSHWHVFDIIHGHWHAYGTSFVTGSHMHVKRWNFSQSSWTTWCNRVGFSHKWCSVIVFSMLLLLTPILYYVSFFQNLFLDLHLFIRLIKILLCYCAGWWSGLVKNCCISSHRMISLLAVFWYLHKNEN